MECVVCVPTKPRWFCERTNYLQELYERAGPPVGKNDGHGVGMRGARVDEVNTKPVDPCAEMRHGVGARFEAPPVIPIPPVLDECSGLVQRHTLGPVTDCLALGVPCGIETLPEVVNGRLGQRYREWRDRFGCGRDNDRRSLSIRGRRTSDRCRDRAGCQQDELA